jgi:type II secretory pathway pseudopilin PulG
MKIFNCLKKKKAFSLVGLIISLVIFTFIISGIFAVLYVGSTTQRFDLALLDL